MTKIPSQITAVSAIAAARGPADEASPPILTAKTHGEYIQEELNEYDYVNQMEDWPPLLPFSLMNIGLRPLQIRTEENLGAQFSATYAEVVRRPQSLVYNAEENMVDPNPGPLQPNFGEEQPANAVSDEEFK